MHIDLEWRFLHRRRASACRTVIRMPTRRALFVAVAAFVHASMASSASGAGIEGRWVTFDDSTHMKRSVVEITRDRNRVTGRIVELFTTSGEDPDPVCDPCTGTDHGRKIRGLPILKVESTSNEAIFTGTVLDPEDGTLYRCTVTLDRVGNQLSVRGYVGLEIFGETVTWTRAE